MSTPDGGKEISLAIRIDTARHAQLTWIAELRGSNLKQECFKAADAYIEAAKQDPDLMAGASAARAAIEEEARARQAAIDNLFIASPPPPGQDEPDVTETETDARVVHVGADSGLGPGYRGVLLTAVDSWPQGLMSSGCGDPRQNRSCSGDGRAQSEPARGRVGEAVVGQADALVYLEQAVDGEHGAGGCFLLEVIDAAVADGVFGE